MNPSFSECAFKLHFPTYVVFDEGIQINYKLIYRSGNKERVLYYRAEIKDKVGELHYDNGNPTLFDTNNKLHKASFRFLNNGKKVFVKGSILKIVFLSDAGERTEVLYEFADDKKLLDVSKFPMSTAEKEAYLWMVESASSERKVIGSGASVGGSSAGFDTEVASELKKYRDALKAEKAFLAAGGGKKYKVTNGRLISSNNGIYSYVFDLETELHIADDAPVTLTCSSGLSTTGNVLMCEDFQMIVRVMMNIGDHVSSATISVEPWKLLDAIENRLKQKIDIKPNRIVSELVKRGPLLATDRPVEQIPKGQDEALRKIKKDPICVIWGPPGTGKTHTMSKAAIQFMEEGKNILIVSHSNVSVDGAAKQISNQLIQKNRVDTLKDGKVLRYISGMRN